MAQKKKVPVKAQTRKLAASKPKSKSLATRTAVAKKSDKSVPAAKSNSKAVKSAPAPKSAAHKKPAKTAKPGTAAKPVAAKVKAPPAKAPVQKSSAAGKSAPAAKPAPVAKPAATPKALAAKPAAAKPTAPVAKAAPAVKAVVPPKVPAAATPAPAVARPAVAAAAKAPSPQVKAPSAKLPVAPTVVAVPPRAGVPVIAPKPATPKDIATKTAEARQQVAAPAAPSATAAAAAAASGPKKIVSQRHGFKTNEYIVYPAHGVGRIVGIEEQEIAGMSLELFVIQFDKDKMTVRVPTGKLQSVGMRKLADDNVVIKALDTLKGRARVKRTMWSRRAQEYEAKINSGDLISIAEVVRDLYRSESQPEQSYSERQLYEAALDRMAREIAAVEKLDERGAVQRINDVLSKSAKGRRLSGEGEVLEADVKAA